MSDPLLQFQSRLGYTFADITLLQRAVTHPSYLQDNPLELESNQRLEFLGDAVLQLILTQALFDLFPADREGALSQRRSALSNGTFLAGLARDLGLDIVLKLGAGEEQTGGRTRASSLEDAFEAVVGAVFTDGGLPTARRVVLGLYGDIPARLASLEPSGNPKGRLQERVQPLHGNTALRYDSVHASGQDHNREYESRVYLLDRLLGSGRGTSKKAAEEAAARAALETLASE